jgi:hypothetical protein
MDKNEAIAKIYNVLFGQVIDVTYLKTDKNFLKNVDDKTNAFFRNPNDNRTLCEVYNATFIGELGEYAIFNECDANGLECIPNDEEFSKEYHWDMNINGLYVEIKSQNRSDPFYFSFDHKRKDQHMVDNFKKLDIVIAYYIKKHNNKTFVIPWMIIHASVLNPNLLYDSKPYYRDSRRNNGRYLIQEAYKDGYVMNLNVNQNKFTFDSK